MSNAPDPASITIEKKGHGLVAHVRVKLLDEKDLERLSLLIDQAAADPTVSTIVIDLSQVQLLPSLGLGSLIQAHRKCAARQQKLKLVVNSPSLRQVFVVTRLDRVLELADSIDAALE
jgi:anti-anti-sigma factor